MELYNKYCKKCKKICVMTPFKILKHKGISLICTNCQTPTGYFNINKLVPFDFEEESDKFDKEKEKEVKLNGK